MTERQPIDPAVAAEADRQHRLIMRGTAYGDESTRRVMSDELRQRLIESISIGDPLRVYLGVDPTSPDLHIGHCVTLRKLQLFQQLGHQAILLIGDFTGLVGDPSDKSSARPMQTAETLERNATTYREQAYKLLDPERTEIRRNSEWLAGMSFEDVIHLAANFTVQQFAERDTFAHRLDSGAPVYVHEFMYGLMQGYDAVALDADIQLGGTDQTFNIGCGRTLQERAGHPPQIAVLTPILIGTDGKQRMSKSTGNYIGIDEPPDAQYAKAMSIPDAAVAEFLVHGTNVDPAEADQVIADAQRGALPAMDAKRRLAGAIVAEWHGAAEAEAAEREWTRVHSRGEAPAEMPPLELDFGGAETLTAPLAVLLADAGAAASRAEAKRLLRQGAVELNGARAAEQPVELRDGDVLKVGKRTWLRIRRT